MRAQLYIVAITKKPLKVQRGEGHIGITSRSSHSLNTAYPHLRSKSTNTQDRDLPGECGYRQTTSVKPFMIWGPAINSPIQINHPQRDDARVPSSSSRDMVDRPEEH